MSTKTTKKKEILINGLDFDKWIEDVDTVEPVIDNLLKFEKNSLLS